jgi:hypothetical protein
MDSLALQTPIPEITRDLWTNKAEFLLSVIGYVVDLGKHLTDQQWSIPPSVHRKCLAVSLHVLQQWRRSLSHSVHDLSLFDWHPDAVSDES